MTVSLIEPLPYKIAARPKSPAPTIPMPPAIMASAPAADVEVAAFEAEEAADEADAETELRADERSLLIEESALLALDDLLAADELAESVIELDEPEDVDEAVFEAGPETSTLSSDENTETSEP